MKISKSDLAMTIIDSSLEDLSLYTKEIEQTIDDMDNTCAKHVLEHGVYKLRILEKYVEDTSSVVSSAFATGIDKYKIN